MIYLDNAATSFPKPKGMAEAMMEHLNAWCGNPGRSGHMFSRRTGEAVYKTRCSLAQLIGAEDPERILFTSNTTGALNQAIQGTLQQSDHVITTAMEHNSVLRPLAALGCRVTILPCREDGSLDIKQVEEAIRPNTKMLVCTMASNVTGTIMPIEELAALCRRHNLLFLVDAAQAAGHMPINIEGIDFLAAPGHKGLLGPMGTGFLYVAPGRMLKPLTQGGTGTLSKERKPEVEFPDSFEAGTVNAPGIVGLGFSVDWLQQVGIDTVWQHQQQLTAKLDENLRNIKNVTVYGPSDCRKKAGIVTLNIKGKDCEEIASSLNDDFDIAVRAGFHCAPLAHKTIGTWDTGAVRISVGYFNTLRHVDRITDAIYHLSEARSSQYLPVRRRGCSVR